MTDLSLLTVPRKWPQKYKNTSTAMKFDNEKFNKAFSLFILTGMATILTITTLIKFNAGDNPTERLYLIISAIGAIAGILSTVCAANGRMLTFLFGIIDVTIYSVMCIISERWGTAAMHIVYLLPMQFVGIWQWKKRGGQKKKEVKARRLDGKKWALTSGLFLLISFITYIILLHFESSSADNFISMAVLSDALVTVCNIFGQFLMSTAFAEQWFFWIGVNISSIVMWSMKMAESENSDFAIIYIIKYSFYLLNALNGLRNWMRMSREQ